MAVDGYLNFNTKVDTTGIDKGVKETEKAVSKASTSAKRVVETALKSVEEAGEKTGNAVEKATEKVSTSVEKVADKISEEANTTANKINEILNDTTRSMESKASAIAGVYRKQGFNQSQAMAKAWEQIERTSKIGNKKLESEHTDTTQKILDNTSEIKSGCSNIGASISKIGSKLNALKNTVIATFSLTAITQGLKAITESSATVKAMGSQYEQTFVSISANAKKAMQAVAKESGIVESRLQGVGTSIFAFAKTTGMNDTTALKMMQEALQVTADSAAYYDRSLEDTSESLKSFLKGNYENDSALGLSCTETTRNAMANKLYGKSFQELSESQKQLALLQMVKEANQLSGAMGQASREADGWENVTGNLKESWKQLLAVVGQPVLQFATQAVKRLTDMLQSLTAHAKTAVNAMYKLFGWEQEKQTTKPLSTVVDNTNNITESIQEAEKASEDFKKSLSGFDKLNVLNENDSTLSKAPATDIQNPANNINSAITNENANKISHIFSKFDSLFNNLKSSFSEVWNNGTGERVWGNILGIATNVKDIIGKIGSKLKIAWGKNDTGKKLWQDILGIVEDITEFGDDLGEITLDWLVGVDFYPLASSTEKLTGAFRRLSKVIGDKIKRLYQKVLLPMGEWTIEEAVPKIIEALATSLEAVADIIDILPPSVIDAFGYALIGIGTGLAVFKAGSTIARGISSVSGAIKIFGAIINSHPLLAGASIIAGITSAIVAFNKTKWSTSEAGKFATEIDKIKGNLEQSTSKIEDALSNTLSNLDNIYQDNNLIDNYQKKLNELLSKAELTPEEQAQLTTIVTYFDNNVDGFSETWDKYVTVSDSGKIELTGDLQEVQSEINNTIDSYQRLANEKVISDMLAENSKTKMSATTELHKAKANLEEQRRIAGQATQAYKDAYENGTGNLTKLYETAQAEWEAVDRLTEEYNRNVAAVNKLTMTNDDLLSVQAVLNGDFSDAASVMMAYNAGMISLQDVTESEYKSLDNLQKAAEASGKNLVIGLVEGSERYKGALIKNSNGLATTLLSEFDTTMDMHSPSKEMEKRGGYIVAGVIIGVNKLRNKLLSTFTKLTSDIKNIFNPIPEWFENIFTRALNGIKSIFGNGITDVIRLSFDNINSAFESVRSFDIGGFKPFKDIANIPVPQIPKLATGTVVPANYGEFTAILGDNKREPEIVSPLSTMKQAMREVLEEMKILQNNNGEMVIVLELDGDVVFKKTVQKNNQYKKRHGGKSAFASS